MNPGRVGYPCPLAMNGNWLTSQLVCSMLKTPDEQTTDSSAQAARTNGLDLSDLDAVDVPDRPNWENGPPHELFKELRGRCPVHWSEIPEYPEEEGFWSVSKAEDVREVSLDWETYSSERRRRHRPHPRDPARAHPQHVHRAGSARSTTASRCSSSAASPRSGSPSTRTGSGRSSKGSSTASPAARRVRPGHRRRPARRRARDRQLHGHPGGGRHRLGPPDELGARPRRRRPQPRRARPDPRRRTSPRSSSAAAR